MTERWPRRADDPDTARELGVLMDSFFVSVGVGMLGELDDKSQIVTIALTATPCRCDPVVAGTPCETE